MILKFKTKCKTAIFRLLLPKKKDTYRPIKKPLSLKQMSIVTAALMILCMQRTTFNSRTCSEKRAFHLTVSLYIFQRTMIKRNKKKLRKRDACT